MYEDGDRERERERERERGRGQRNRIMNIGDILSMFNKLERYKEEWLRGTEPREEEKLESSTWSIQKLGPWILNSPVRPSAIAKSNSRISKWPRADSTKDKLLKPGYSFATESIAT